MISDEVPIYIPGESGKLQINPQMQEVLKNPISDILGFEVFAGKLQIAMDMNGDSERQKGIVQGEDGLYYLKDFFSGQLEEELRCQGWCGQEKLGLMCSKKCRNYANNKKALDFIEQHGSKFDIDDNFDGM